jgi:hypothetical protein
MILTQEQITQLTDEEGVYDCRLVAQQFAYKLLKENVSPLGDVFCFASPTRIGPLGLEDAVVLVGEIPNTDMFGATCFLRLYSTQLGSLLSVLTGKESYVEDSSIFIENKQASLTFLNRIKDSVVFHIVFPTLCYTEGVDFYTLDLEGQIMTEFKANAIECFKHMVKSIFIETRRDNF